MGICQIIVLDDADVNIVRYIQIKKNNNKTNRGIRIIGEGFKKL